MTFSEHHQFVNQLVLDIENHDPADEKKHTEAELDRIIAMVSGDILKGKQWEQ